MIEADKYQSLWQTSQYRQYAPGEHTVDLFVKLAKPQPQDIITDYGCGTGRAALKLSAYAQVRMLDFTTNSLDPLVKDSLSDSLTIDQHDLLNPITTFSKFGYCTDVMEHIQPENVIRVLHNIVTSSRHVFFQISCVPDVMGALIGEQLHLTVQPYSWWLEQFNSLQCSIHFSQDNETDCIFYVSAWATGKDIKGVSSVNTEDEQIRKNVLFNLQLGLPEVRPYEQQDKELVILAGGPSLNDFEDEIKLNKRMGVPVVTLNGAYNWALDKGIKPDVQIVLDAREFNQRFVEPIVPTCKYLISTQCDPDLVRAIPKDQIYLWHSGADVVQSCVEELGITRDIYPTYGGMTIPLRAIPLLIMLGYSKFVIYGFDSCLKKGEHHAYLQPENDYNTVIDVTCGNRQFKAHGWMLTQAYEFIELQPMISDLCEIEVKGDGLISHIIETGYELSLSNEGKS
jgi:hypothetical protein